MGKAEIRALVCALVIVPTLLLGLGFTGGYFVGVA